jgi:TolB-like protein
MKKIGILVAAAALSISLAGCESLPVPNSKPEPVKADILGSSHAAADVLIQRAGDALKPGKSLIGATFVNIDDLNRASSFGRIVSGQVATRFTEQGHTVVEMLLRNNVYIKQRGGEFLLSRELRNISSEHNAQAVIVGTYAVARKNVYVTARLIRAKDSVILASYDYSLPLDRDVAFMLKNG